MNDTVPIEALPGQVAGQSDEIDDQRVRYLPVGEMFELHELARAYRPALKSEYENLAARIKSLDRIAVPVKVVEVDGKPKLVDGNTRQKIALEQKRPLPYQIIREPDLQRLAALVFEWNHSGKKLDERDAAMAAARMETRTRGGHQRDQRERQVLTQELAAQITGSSVRSIGRAKAIIDTGETALIAAVDDHTIGLAHGEKIARLSGDALNAALEALVSRDKDRVSQLIKGLSPSKTTKASNTANADDTVAHTNVFDALLSALDSAIAELRVYPDQLETHDIVQSQLEGLLERFDDLDGLIKMHRKTSHDRLMERV